MTYKEQDKVCECCGSSLQGDHGYCPECNDCLGTCDWRGTDAELQRRIGTTEVKATEEVDN